MAPSHLDPAQAVQALEDLGAARLASMHWGTFVLSREPLLEPLELLRAAWDETGRDRGDLWDLAVGGSGVI
jgi:L-ascorbate metabolism protein UlaG (beta-lactamase superfamily)